VVVLAGHLWRRLSARQALIGASSFAALVVLIALVVSVSTTGPWKRVIQFLPTSAKEGFTINSRDGVEFALRKLWTRDMYGPPAMLMISEHPLVGVGVGGFNYLYTEALYLIDRSVRPPDNAQNWYRQQFAELGVLGSVGWMVSVGMFVWIVTRRPAEKTPTARAVMGALLGIAAASILGVPTQDAAAAVTVTVFVCWCLKLQGADQAQAGTRSNGRLAWLVATAVLLCFLGGTAMAAARELRPPIRAMRVDRAYRYGFTKDSNNPERFWTGAKAVDVFSPEKRWLEIVFGEVAPDAEQKPVTLTVSFNGDRILRVNRRGNFPITRWIRMPANHPRVMVQIDVGRTWRPTDFGNAADRTARGVAIDKWTFVDEDPPKGSVTVE